jgi:hypothetical protein
MSRCALQRLRCPRCGAVQEEKIFLSVNGARIRTAADRIIDGTWGAVSCLSCGNRYFADPPILYSDLPGGLWIVRYPLARRANFESLENEAAAIFQKEFLDRPPAAIREQAAAVRRRICFGRWQMAEKLLAWRLGIDDRALECLKLALTRDYIAELFPHGPCEWHLGDANDQQLEFRALPMAEPRPVFEVIVGREKLEMIGTAVDEFQLRFPELFSRLYVNAARYVTAERAREVQ